MEAKAGWTNIFIYPGYRFKVLDALITNFHLPESTLIMLVSALAGREHVLAAYNEAVKRALSLLLLRRRHVYFVTGGPPVFEVKKTEGRGPPGEFTCPHGTVQTPVFMNVGTQGAIKGGGLRP